MKHLFIIVDTSGSITVEGRAKKGQINDLLRDLLAHVKNVAASVSIITYADIPRTYWTSSTQEIYEDIPQGEFGGRSNLGKAYAFVKEIMGDRYILASQACIVLISDGEATDDYESALKLLDPKDEAIRIAGGIGTGMDTLEDHVINHDLIFTDITTVGARDEFFDEIFLNLK